MSEKKKPRIKKFNFGTFTFFFLLISIVLTVMASHAVEFSWERLRDGTPYMLDFLSRMWPPDQSVLSITLTETLLTVQLAWVSTVIAAILSIPIAFLAASTMGIPSWVRSVTLLILGADRALDALILALFFVSAVGLGPFPGVLALAIHSVGMLAKLFADTIESVDTKPIEALRSVGASKILIMRWAIIPQVIPHWISLFLFRFELNVRAAMILGLVGAGGIGFILNQYMRTFQYHKVTTALLVILVVVLSIDFVSQKLRRRLI